MSSVEFSSGVQVSGTFNFSSGGSKAEIVVNKYEATERTYNLAIEYLGPDEDDRPGWRVRINHQNLVTPNGDELLYSGSRKFEFHPSLNEAILIEETDENALEKLWIDMSERRYTVSESPIELDDRIQALVQKAKLFKPSDKKEVKKIFYNNSVGVILYASGDRSEDIYFAKKEDDEFVKCEYKMISQCRCPKSDSNWKVSLPGEDKSHQFLFARGRESANGHATETSWDGIYLKKIVV